jgi:hypothetical protein
VRIGVDDGLQLSFVGAIPAIAVRVVAADEAFVGAADIIGGGGIAEPERAERLGVAEAGPAPHRRRRPRFAGEQVVRVAEGEGFAAAAVDGALPAGERRLGGADLVGRQAIEEIIRGIEGADMVEAEELPAGLVTGDTVRTRRAEFAGRGAAWLVARRFAVEAAVEALAAPGRVGRVGGDDGIPCGVAVGGWDGGGGRL